MIYRIEFTPSAARAYEKLSGHKGRYRIRIGEWRVIYVIADGHKLITVAVSGHRREVYR